MKLLPRIEAEGGAEWLARTATQSLIDEARLSPKPGLVDSRGNGAHHDLTLALMERSAHSLTSHVSGAGATELAAAGRYGAQTNRRATGPRRRAADDGGNRRREYPSWRDLGAGVAGQRGGDARRQRPG